MGRFGELPHLTEEEWSQPQLKTEPLEISTVVSGRNLTADFLVLWLLRSFHPLLNVPLGMGAVLQMCPGVRLPTFGCPLHDS